MHQPSKDMRPDEQPHLILPTDAKERKKFPMFSGLKAYFPNALACVARMSWEGQQQHNPGKPLAWDKVKSPDELDALERHQTEGEWVQVAWRALAHLEREIIKGWRPKWDSEQKKVSGDSVAISAADHEEWRKFQEGMNDEAARWAVVDHDYSEEAKR
jgi:hypothetical protein